MIESIGNIYHCRDKLLKILQRLSLIRLHPRGTYVRSIVPPAGIKGAVDSASQHRFSGVVISPLFLQQDLEV